MYQGLINSPTEIIRKQAENMIATLSSAKDRKDIVAFSSVQTKKGSEFCFKHLPFQL
jgi:hypothetical protein